MIAALDRKLLRDLWRVRSMGLAIAVVVASGIALLVASLICFDSLETTRDRYYARNEFGDVFANAKRVPRWVAGSLDELPGVVRADTRVVAGVTLDVPGSSEPVNGRLISLPDSGRPVLNGVTLRSGRWPDPGRAEEAIVNERFAQGHGLELGDQVFAVINGRRQRLEIVGTALSPEYVYAIAGGDLLPDPTRFGVFWMARRHLATAFDMEGGFNDIALSLAEGAAPEPAIAELDRLLEPYGGLGAIPRAQQISHWYLQNELTGLRGMALLMPMIFLGIAAFLLNVVLRRMVAVQREQIAVLKAIGYSNLRLGLHFTQWAVVVSVPGRRARDRAGRPDERGDAQPLHGVLPLPGPDPALELGAHPGRPAGLRRGVGVGGRRRGEERGPACRRRRRCGPRRRTPSGSRCWNGWGSSGG